MSMADELKKKQAQTTTTKPVLGPIKDLPTGTAKAIQPKQNAAQNQALQKTEKDPQQQAHIKKQATALKESVSAMKMKAGASKTETATQDKKQTQSL